MANAGRSAFLAAAGLLAAFGATLPSAAQQAADPGRRTGFDVMSPQTQAMQRDDAANPGMLWALEGDALWRAPAGDAGRSCAACHGEPASMTGVSARYPAWSEAAGRPVDLQTRINLCRVDRQNAPPFALESRELLALATLVGRQSRGLPVSPPQDARLTPIRQAGADLYARRQGQLDLSCADCHDAHVGGRLGGSVIPPATPTGYPLYRLEWQDLGSLQRRLRNCLTGMRAEPYPFGAPEYVALEAFLAERAQGLPVETPAVRP
ncbi:sulfur oxidation c-type cytochrome SoxA [Alsobacter sp. KACC 23698]|uniref:SoxAX cytochrome complex subunit A n=1 Tax=Alsobacter sp. KACC 23698 TaxID=3149229 RepID=A0AAU7JK02_9HYPH